MAYIKSKIAFNVGMVTVIKVDRIEEPLSKKLLLYQSNGLKKKKKTT